MINRRFRAIPLLIALIGQFLFTSAVFADGCCERLSSPDKPSCSDPSCVSACFTMPDQGSCDAFGQTIHGGNQTKTVQWNSGKCWGLPECAGNTATSCCIIEDAKGLTCYATQGTQFNKSACDALGKSKGSTKVVFSTDACNAGNNNTLCGTHLEDPNMYAPANSQKNNEISPPPPSFIPDIVVPKLQVEIPNVSFSKIAVQDQGGKKYIDVPYIAQYISGIYNYILGIIGTIAITMIIVGGVKYIIAGGDTSRVTAAKANITNAVIGLIIAFSTYLILSTINPALVTPKTIRVPVVSRIELHLYSKMDEEYGFKDGDAADANEKAASQGGIDGGPSSGSKFTEIISQSCTPKAQAGGVTSCEGKQDLLAKALLGFKKVCVDMNGCVYVRGGYTSIPSGKVVVTANDTPWLIDYFNAHNIKYDDWSADCKTKWAEPDFAKNYNKLRATPEYTLFQFANNVLVQEDSDVSKEPFASHHCWVELQKKYVSFVKKTLEGPGIFGADCGSTLIQIFNCAGVEVPQMISQMASSPNAVVRSALNYDQFKKQIDAAGGLVFGDIFIMGGTDPNTGKAAFHNMMYTGGRDDVPFTFFEMGFSPSNGGSGAGEDVQTGTAKLRGDSFNGVAVHGKASDQLFWNITRRYPITVVRPYGKDCKNKAPTETQNAVDNNAIY